MEYLLVLFYVSGSLLDVVSSQCSGTKETKSVGYSTVTVSPPGYPNGYSINMDCSWLITSSVAGSVILFRVTEITLDCTGDAVNVYDGSSTSGTHVHINECNSGSPGARILSYRTAASGNVYITFASDTITSSSELGYLMYLISGRDLSGTGCTTTEELTATNSEQFLTSPGFPNEYLTDQTCTWVIRSQSNQKVYVEIRFMDIEYEAACGYDYLEVIESGSSVPRECSEGIWNSSYNYTSAKNNITVKFHTDGAVGKRGFLLAYWETEQETTTATTAPTTKEKETTTNLETTTNKEEETTTVTTVTTTKEETTTVTTVPTTKEKETTTNLETTTNKEDETTTVTTVPIAKEEETTTVTTVPTTKGKMLPSEKSNGDQRIIILTFVGIVVTIVIIIVVYKSTNSTITSNIKCFCCFTHYTKGHTENHTTTMSNRINQVSPTPTEFSTVTNEASVPPKKCVYG